MKVRCLRILLIVFLFLPLSGCPVPSVTLGIWLIALNGGSPSALTLLQGGQTEIPDPIPPGIISGFGGQSTWEQRRSTFTLTQDFTGPTTQYTYTGTVNSSSSISGTWEKTVGAPPESGTWTAELLP